MVLTLFISEDKRDEFAGTAWPFDSLLEHTNQGALAQTVRGTGPQRLTPPSRPLGLWPRLLHLPGQEDDPLSGRVGPWPHGVWL